MRTIIIAFGTIAILAAFGVQGWAAEGPLYGCYQDNEQVRVVDVASDCLPSETVVALNRTNPESTPRSRGNEETQGKIKEYPSKPLYGLILGPGGGFGSP